MQRTSLSELVRRAQEGDRAALERLLSESEPAMRRLAGRVCPAGDAEDAVQEVLWRVSDQVGTLRVSAAFLGWSMKMLVRECLKFKRRAVRWVLTEEEPTTMPEPLQRDLVRALSSLSKKSREVLLERDVLGYTARETAERLDLSVESVKSRLRRARSELKEAYDGNAD